jgi:hypothetical protein
MAEVDAVAVLILVVEDLIEDGIIEEGSIIATELANLTDGAEPELSNIIQTAIDEGQSQGQALDTAYNTIFEISPDAASGWAETMAEEGYDFGSGSSAEDADFEDTDPDSDPDKGEPDTAACQDNPEGPECQAQTQSKLSRFFEFMKNWGGTIGSFIVFGVAAIYIFIGQVARWICETIQKIKGGCTTQQCIDQKCNTALCNATKNIINFIRRFWIVIAVIIVGIGIGLTFFFRSISPLIIFSIILLILMVFKTVIGNLIATIVCDVSASTCIFRGQPINC